MKIRKKQYSLFGEGPENAYSIALVGGFAIALAGVSKEDNSVKITGWEIHGEKVRSFIWGCERKNHPVDLKLSSFFDTLKENIEQKEVSDAEEDEA
jgi:hypothetical protein